MWRCSGAFIVYFEDIHDINQELSLLSLNMNLTAKRNAFLANVIIL